MVGEGTISESLGGGSFRDSVFQIPVPQGNELPPTCGQFIELVNPGLVLVGHPDWSVAGLVGFVIPVDRGPAVVKDALRGRLAGTSFSQEVRRAGLGTGAAVDTGGNWVWSPSSSEDARASESGVERRTPG